MNHSQVIEQMVAEKYLLNELSDEERLQYEEHFFGCDVCAEDLLAAFMFLSVLRQVWREMLKP